MTDEQLTIRRLVESAARPFPSLWHDGKLVGARLAKFCKEHGHPVSQATISRQLGGKQGTIDDVTIKAFEAVLKIPRAMLRKEPLNHRMEEILKRYSLEVLVFADQLSSLPPEEFEPIARLIEAAYKRSAAQHRALDSKNVTSIDKHRK